MTAEIMKAEAAVPAIQWSPDQVETIKNTVAKGATDDELRMFLHLSQTYGLDPFAKELWFIKMDNTPIITTSRDGYLKIANRDPHFEGMEADVVYSGDSFRKTNKGIEHVYGAKERGAPIGAYCIVYRSDRKIPTYVYAPFKDYNKGGNWSKFPHAMILKVAEAQALKRAFSIAGLVTREEIEEGVPHAAESRSHGTDDIKNELWSKYLTYFDNDVERAKAEMLKTTGGRGSKEWTAEDLRRLAARLEEPVEAEVVEAALPLDEPEPPEAPARDETSDPEELLRREVEELLGPSGLYLTGGEKEQYIFERTKTTDLRAVPMSDLSKIARDARAELDRRNREDS